MQLTYWVLLALAILYIPLFIWVKVSPKAKGYGLHPYGPFIMIKTRLGIRAMDRVKHHKSLWNLFGLVSLAITALLMVMLLYIIGASLINITSNLSSPGIGIEYALAIPGLNPLLPITYGWIGLFAAMIIHEMAHGIQARANDIKVESTGLLYAVVPMGAFVDPNEEDVVRSSVKARLHLYSAGISINFITAVITFLLFSTMIMGGMSTSHGDSAGVYGITNDSPALDAGMPIGAIIDQVWYFDDGSGEWAPCDYEFSSDHTKSYAWSPGQMVKVSYLTENGEGITDEFRWGLYVERVAGGPAMEHLPDLAGNLILSMSITRMGGSTTSYDIYGSPEFMSIMDMTTGDDLVSLVYMDASGNTTVSDEFKLDWRNGIGYLGIGATTSGMNIVDPVAILNQSVNPFYGADSMTEYAKSMVSYISGPMRGMTPVPASIHWWYDAPMEEVFWVIVNILYWIFWLSIILAISNVLPAYPFDGGHIVAGCIEGLMLKRGIRDKARIDAIVGRTMSVLSMFTILLFVLMISAIVF